MLITISCPLHRRCSWPASACPGKSQRGRELGQGFLGDIDDQADKAELGHQSDQGDTNNLSYRGQGQIDVASNHDYKDCVVL